MQIYNYHSATGEYLGSSTAPESPLEPGAYLLPAHATQTSPPDAIAGHARCWDGGAWGQVEDHRGEQGYANGAALTVTELGALPDDWSTTAPTPTEADLAATYRAARDIKLTDCEWLVTRHRDQVDAVAAGLLAKPTLTTAQYQELLAYRQALRDITAQAGWPGSITWPSKPEWMPEA